MNQELKDKYANIILFGRGAHDSINQKRKYTGEPYWVHTENVADLAYKVTKDKDIFTAAILHDSAEDIFPKNKDYSYSLLQQKFGKRVVSLVAELTDVYTHEAFPMFNREQRKKLEAARIACISNDAKNIKLCDIIDNTKDIVENDKDFAVVYLREKWRLLKALFRGSNKKLWLYTFLQLIKGKLELLKD